MARAESRRLMEQRVRESTLLRKYQEGMNTHVLAIKDQFDARISQEIGFQGNIFDTMRDSLVKDNGRLFLQNVPEQFHHYIDKNEDKNPIFHYSSESLNYTVQPGEYQSKVEMSSNTAELVFTAPRRSTGTIEAISAQIKGPYNWSRTSEPTERSMTFSNNSKNAYEVLLIGQKREDITIAPLIYGDLDQSGNAYLHLDQPINAHGAPLSVELAEGVTIYAKNKKFYFPLEVNWQHELADISGKLLYE